ncbi:MAG: hypothetical protein J1F05_04480 [Muribaculaceae bacterium]|nr:hypothetical protein [Muribaculaceae bacterium]
MRRIAKNIYVALAVLLLGAGLTSCNDDMPDNRQPVDSVVSGVEYDSDGKLSIRLDMEIPGMTSAASRALGEKPNYENLTLYLLVFDDDEGLRQYTRIPRVPDAPDRPHFDPNQPDDEHSHSELITFDIKLEPTDKPTVIHLIATDQPDFNRQVIYGTEDRVIPQLYTDNEHEAYWQRIDLGTNIPSREKSVEYLDEESKAKGEKNEDYDPEEYQKAENIKKMLTHVPMVRNFCRVSLELGSGVTNFVPTGLYVINTLDCGTIAPYYVTADGQKGFVEYYEHKEPGNEKSQFIGRSYDDISAQGHVGSVPAVINLINTDPEDPNFKSKDENPEPGKNLSVYFYERPARDNTTVRTYAIVKGRYNGSRDDSYYKIDLGFIKEGDEIGLFQYYNLLRNFDFVIKIASVENAGYGSFKDAISGAVFNNFSAAVEARNMKSISDGEDMIFVSFTSYVFTQPNQVKDLLAQYLVGMSAGNRGTIGNGLLKYKLDPPLGEGDVIASVVENINTTGADPWNTYTVTGMPKPDSRLRQQTLYIYRGNRAAAGQPVDYGLYRAVTFFMHEPWPLLHIDTFPGLWDWDQIEELPNWDWTEDYYREIGQSKGSPLTLFFELPPGIPQALFPLDFVIESDRQNIQNAYVGNAVVQSVPAEKSLFYVKNPTAEQAKQNPTTSRIQYVKTVTWDQYNTEKTAEIVGTGSAVVRCRFLTITDLAQEGVGSDDGKEGNTTHSKSTTKLRVYNEYFGQLIDGDWQMYYEDGFERSTRTSDPSPRFWDFNSAVWDQTFDALNNTSRSAYTEGTYVMYDELRFIDGSNNTNNFIRTAVDADTIRYVRTPNTANKLRHVHTYSPDQERKIRINVVSTDNNGTPTAPTINFTTTPANSISAPEAPSQTLVSGSKTTYVYIVTVPEEVTNVTVDIMPSQNNMRFYQVDFYPRWDDLAGTEDDSTTQP